MQSGGVQQETGPREVGLEAHLDCVWDAVRGRSHRDTSRTARPVRSLVSRDQ